MKKNTKKTSALVVEYTDPLEGFQGWLVIDTLDHKLCAGGMRVQKGLTCERLADMARNMTCKMRLCGLRVDGAKCGIDYDPLAPGKYAAMARFMAAIKPYVVGRYSMGPDLNVEMAELESIGHEIGLASVKMAVARAQGWDLAYFNKRYQILTRKIDGRPLGTIRAGYGVAMAVLGVLDHLGIPHNEAPVVLQGFGTLARAAAYGLARKGVRIMAIADAEKCYVSRRIEGLDINCLLKTDGPLLPAIDKMDDVVARAREDLYQVPCDILIPAAVENTITREVAEQLKVRAVVPGANLAVTAEGDQLLFERNIPAVPDFLAGCGGSLSMEGLFAPLDHPQPRDVLDHVEQRMVQLIHQTLARSTAEKITPVQAALLACSEIVVPPGRKAYELKVKS